MKKRVEAFLKWFAIYLGVAGLVTFSMFILEESFQTAMFGTWPAQDAGDWTLVREGIDIMEGTNRALEIVTYAAGWVQPLALLSYHQYAKSEDFYIKALRAKAFANCPECFVGETVTFGFAGNTKEYDGKTVIHRFGQIAVYSYAEELPARITGKVMKTAEGIVVDVRGVPPPGKPTIKIER